MAPSVINLGKEASLKILCATEGNKLVGIAPFRKTRRSLKGKIGYNIIEPLTNGNTDYTGVILTEQETQCLSKFLAYLFTQKDWDLFYLPDLPETSPIIEMMKNTHQNLPGFDIEKGCVCPYLTIPNSKEKFLASLNPKFRKELKRRMQKLEKERGRVEFKHYYELGSLEQAMNLLFKLHQKRWASKDEDGAFKSQEARNITMQTAKFFADRDWLRLYFLTVNKKPVAAELDLEYRGRMYGHIAGFDPDYSRYSVGNLLMLKILEECIAKGISEYDFMQGCESYKLNWTSKYRQSMNLKFVNTKPSSKLINLVLRILNRSEFCTRKIFPVFQKLI